MLVCGRCGYYNSDVSRRCEQCNARLSAAGAESSHSGPAVEAPYAAHASPGRNRAVVEAGPAAVTTAAQAVYGGFWPRAGAFLVDSFVIGFGLALTLIILPAGLGLLVLFLGPAVYEVAAETSTGATLGKKVFRLRVLTTDFQPLTVGHALVRYFAHFVSAFFLLGYLVVLFNDENRALHDYIAGTVVIDERGIDRLRRTADERHA